MTDNESKPKTFESAPGKGYDSKEARERERGSLFKLLQESERELGGSSFSYKISFLQAFLPLLQIFIFVSALSLPPSLSFSLSLSFSAVTAATRRFIGVEYLAV